MTEDLVSYWREEKKRIDIVHELQCHRKCWGVSRENINGGNYVEYRNGWDIPPNT